MGRSGYVWVVGGYVWVVCLDKCLGRSGYVWVVVDMFSVLNQKIHVQPRGVVDMFGS